MNDIKQQSTFVTVIAWIFIIFSGLGSLVSIMQNILIRTMFSGDRVQEALSRTENTDQMPQMAKFMFQHMDTFFLAFMILTIFLFISSIALLKRKNWARLVFIVMMALGILWNIGGLFIQASIMNTMPQTTNAEMANQFNIAMSVMRVGSYIFAAVFTGLYLWILVRLLSKDVKAEFNAT